MALILSICLFPALTWAIVFSMPRIIINLAGIFKWGPVVLVAVCIYVVFYFSYYQALLTSQLIPGNIYAQQVMVYNGPYHPASATEIYFFHATDPSRQWVMKFMGFGISALMIISIILSVSGVRKLSAMRLKQVRAQRGNQGRA